MAVLGLAERRRERIGGDLQNGDSARQYEQPEQHQIVGHQVRRGEHQQAADCHQREGDENRRDGLHPGEQEGGGKAHHSIGDEERKCAELSAHVGQAEDALHGGDHGIVERGDEAPGKEQAGDDHIGAGHARTLPLLLHARVPSMNCASDWQRKLRRTRTAVSANVSRPCSGVLNSASFRIGTAFVRAGCGASAGRKGRRRLSARQGVRGRRDHVPRNPLRRAAGRGVCAGKRRSR